MSQIHRGPNLWAPRQPGADPYGGSRPAGSPRVFIDRNFSRSQERFSPAPRRSPALGSSSPVPSIRRGYPNLLSPSMASVPVSSVSSKDKASSQRRGPTLQSSYESNGSKASSPVFHITQLPYVQDREGGSVDNSGGSSADSHSYARGASKSGTDDTIFDSLDDGGVDQYEDASETSHMTTPDAGDEDVETFDSDAYSKGKHARSRSGASTGSNYSSYHREQDLSVDSANADAEGDEEPEPTPAPAPVPTRRQQSVERPAKSHKRQPSSVKSAKDGRESATSPSRTTPPTLHSYSPLGQTIEKQRRLVETHSIEMQRRIAGGDRSRSTDAIPQLGADAFSGIPRASPNLGGRAATADGPGAGQTRFGGGANLNAASSGPLTLGRRAEPRPSTVDSPCSPIRSPIQRAMMPNNRSQTTLVNTNASPRASAPAPAPVGAPVRTPVTAPAPVLAPIDTHQASTDISPTNGLGLVATSAGSTVERRESITFPALRQAWKEREQISAQNDLSPRERLKRASGYLSSAANGSTGTAMANSASAMTISTSTSSMATANSGMSLSSSASPMDSRGPIAPRPQRELMPPPSAADMISCNSSAMGSTPYLSAASTSDLSDDGSRDVGSRKPWNDPSRNGSGVEWGGSSSSLPRHPALQAMGSSSRVDLTSDDAERRPPLSARSGTVAGGSTAGTPVAQPRQLGSSGGASGPADAHSYDWPGQQANGDAAADVDADGHELGKQPDGFGGLVGPGSFLVRDRTQSQTSDNRSFVTAGGTSFRGPMDPELPPSSSFVMVPSGSAISDTEEDNSRKYPPPARGNATPRKGRSRSGSISGFVGVFKGLGSKMTGSLGKKAGKSKDVEEPRSAAAALAAEHLEAFQRQQNGRQREQSAPATFGQDGQQNQDHAKDQTLDRTHDVVVSVNRDQDSTKDSASADTQQPKAYAASQRSRRPSVSAARRPGSTSSSYAPSVRPSISMPNITRDGDRHQRNRKNRASIISAHATQAVAVVSGQAPSRAVSPARTQIVRAAIQIEKQSEAVRRAADAGEYGEAQDYNDVAVRRRPQKEESSAAADFFGRMEARQPSSEELETLSPVEQYIALAAQFAEGGGKAIVQKLANEGVRLQREQRARELEVEKMQEKIHALLPDNLDREAVRELHLSMATRVPKGFGSRKTTDIEASKERVARLDERLSALETEMARQKVRLGRIAKERPALSRRLALEKSRFEKMRDLELRLRKLRPAAFKQATEARGDDKEDDDDEHLIEMHDDEDGIQAPGSGRAIVYGEEEGCVRKLRGAVLTQKVTLSMLKTHETSCYSQLLIAEEGLRSCITLTREVAETLENLCATVPEEQPSDYKTRRRLSISSGRPKYPPSSRASMESVRYPPSSSSAGRRGSRSGPTDMAAADEGLRGEEAEEHCERIIYLRRKIEARAFQVEEILRSVQTAYAKAERLANRSPGGSGQHTPSDNGRQRHRLNGAQSDADIRSTATSQSSTAGVTISHLLRLLSTLRVLSMPHATPTQLLRSSYKVQQWASRARATLPQLQDAREMLDDVIVDAEETSEKLAEECVARMAVADEARLEFYTTSARVLMQKWAGDFEMQ